MLALVISACSTPQKITGSWVNKEVLPRGPFTKVFVVAMSPNNDAKIVVENQLSKLLESRGLKTVKSNELFPPQILKEASVTKDMLFDAMKRAGCDAVLSIALMDVATVEKYVPGASYVSMGYNGYAPMGMYGYYGGFYSYYDYRYPQLYSPGYYTTDKTYFLETNFYELEPDQLLWSIQSNAYNSKSLNSWFKGYSELMINQLKKEGIIK